MTIPVFTLEQLDAVYKIDKDWLFDKLLVMLSSGIPENKALISQRYHRDQTDGCREEPREG